MSRYFQIRSPRFWLPVLFFLSILLIGVFIHRDYGLSWDDPVQHQLGLDAWDYVLGKNQNLFTNTNCYINPFVAMLEVLPEKILKPSSERSANMMRHLFNFTLCWAGLIFFYLLALRLFRNYLFALIACLLLLLTPRLFAHSFYNSKDLPFLFLFVACAYLLVVWLEHPSWRTLLWMTIFSGLLTATRVAGVLFPVIFISIIIIKIISWQGRRKELVMAIFYTLLYPLAVYVFFPSIWKDPLPKFFNALALYSHHPYDVTTLFMGETVHSLNTPWYYVPVWMAITIPIGWWILFFAGLIFLAVKFFQNGFHDSFSWLVIIMWLFVPLSVEILIQSNTYEDGRHLFFIEPPLLLIATYGLKRTLQYFFSAPKLLHLTVPAIMMTIFLSTTIYLISFMIRFHPYQYCYFNAVGRKYATNYFDKDYWGVSFRNALEYLVASDHENQINVSWNIDPCEWNLAWLKNEDRNRIHVDRREGYYDYFITNYRSHRPADASQEKIYEITVQGITIMAIYKMPPSSVQTSQHE